MVKIYFLLNVCNQIRKIAILIDERSMYITWRKADHIENIERNPQILRLPFLLQKIDLSHGKILVVFVVNVFCKPCIFRFFLNPSVN